MTERGYDFEAIKAKYPINEIIGRDIQLKKKGKEYVGLCPFHPDRNPSFQVIPHKDNGFAYCPSCGWHGDVVKFVAEYGKITIGDAVRKLTGESPVRETEEDKAERKRAIEAREQREAESRVKAIAVARQIWDSAAPANEDHPYLVKKGVEATLLRQEGDKLVLPVFNADGEIQSIQTIDPSGRKMFHPGAPVAYGKMAIGLNWESPAILCEGYATGATIHEATGSRVIITYSMGNMEKVARRMAEGGTRLILAADTGRSTEYMTKLAEELGLGLAVPVMKGDGTDFNDMDEEAGLDAVKLVFDEAEKTYEKKCKEVDTSSPIYGGTEYPFDISKEKLTEPPGWAGTLTDWIESQSRRPRRVISTAAALTAIGNIAGLTYIDGRDHTTTNLFAFCIAGSRTGKESIMQAVAEVHRVAGVSAATHGSIKSEQEIVRNLMHHQAAFYVIDEIGDYLEKIRSAQKRGGALYLEGVIAMLMAAQSKTNGYMLLTGDVKRGMEAEMVKELSQLNRKLEDDPGNESLVAMIAGLENRLRDIDNGLRNPFLSVIGFTTPIAFDSLVDHRAATNGFIGRSLIFNERDTAPRSKVTKGFHKPEMDMAMQMRIKSIAMREESPGGRIEHYAERKAVPCDDEADQMLEQVVIWLEDQANAHKMTSNLESLYMGAYELVSKISLILAIPDGVKRAEHVRWAFALVVRDLAEKVRLVMSNEREKDDPVLAMQAKIINLCSGDGGESLGVIYGKMRPKKKGDIDGVIAGLIDKGALKRVETMHKFNKRKIVHLIAKR